jgi:hypothetical protein
MDIREYAFHVLIHDLCVRGYDVSTVTASTIKPAIDEMVSVMTEEQIKAEFRRRLQ